jgi:streptogramin lyase
MKQFIGCDAASLNSPTGVALGPNGDLFIVDSANNRIRRVAPDGTISTFAGNGVRGSAGDGGSALEAALSFQTNEVAAIAVRL